MPFRRFAALTREQKSGPAARVIIFGSVLGLDPSAPLLIRDIRRSAANFKTKAENPARIC
jgi:hypothetical protein